MKRFLVVGLLALVAIAATACGGAASAPKFKGDTAKGKTVFASSCSACHGADAKGLPGLGKDMTTSSFIKGLNEDQFLDFLKKGRPASDPANTTKVDMPPKGGNTSLTDQDMYDVIAYIRSLVK